MADKAASGAVSPAAGSPTSASASAYTPSASRSAAAASSATPSASTPATATSSGQQSQRTGKPTRKRVFTFQKRWLHSLPIVERSISDVSLDDRAMKSVRPGESNESENGDEQKEVVVCMLCDDPTSKRELTKVWSRLNCRRGRIENHLMSKHPEFMLLLKHKREAEGDVGVQILLQNMREGRCNLRNEINVGLYGQLQGIAPAPSAAANMAMRSAVAHTAAASDAASAATPTSVHSELQKRAFGTLTPADYALRDASLDVESLRKRAKLLGPLAVKDASASMASVYSTGMMMRANAGLSTSAVGTGVSSGESGASSVESLAASSALYQDPVSGLMHWQSTLFNKLVVVTGGEKKGVPSVARQLWRLGASVLLTFTELSVMDDFATTNIARLQEPSPDGLDAPRGVIVPMMCSFETREQIDEWSHSIAAKFPRVDFLINCVEDGECGKAESTAPISDDEDMAKQVTNDQNDTQESKNGEKDSSDSSATHLGELCRSLISACFPELPAASNDDAVAAGLGTRAIINIATTTNDEAFETLTRSLAAELPPRKVQMNCILLRPAPLTDSTASESNTSDSSGSMSALLSTILFLLAPTSRLLSGSVLRIQDSSLSACSTMSPATAESAGAVSTVEPVATPADRTDRRTASPPTTPGEAEVHHDDRQSHTI